MKNTSWKETFRLKRYYNAVLYAFYGFKQAFVGEPAFRIEVIAFAFFFPLSFYISENKTELALLIASLFLVLITELLNSAVESAIDRIGMEINPLSKRAKDIASTAVFLSIINALIIWLIILF